MTVHATDALATTRFRKRPLPEVFWDRLDYSGECWTWTGHQGSAFGYGIVNLGRRRLEMRAHRYAWEITHGCPIPDGLFVCHRCDNPPCCRPSHLFLGTVVDNNADTIAKGRGRLQKNPGLVLGERNPAAKITDAQRDEIRRRYAVGDVLQRELAAEYGITQTRVSQITGAVPGVVRRDRSRAA